MYIGYNKYQVFGKIIVLVIFISFMGLFIYFLPHLHGFRFTFQTLFAIIIWLLIFWLFIIMTLHLLFFPKAVEINDVEKTLTVHYFFLQPNIIYITDMFEYSTTKLVTKSTSYEGILLRCVLQCNKG
jgi:hypothetical protein